MLLLQFPHGTSSSRRNSGGWGTLPIWQVHPLFGVWNQCKWPISPVAFGLLFGNEDKTNWATFWNFVKEVQLSLYDPRKIFLTDQDKGCLASLQDTFKHASQFMCLFHRHQNILKNCGGGKGKIPYSALWVYNMLTSCHDIETLEKLKTKYYNHMHPTDSYYLQRLLDYVQYPVSRCAMDVDVCMFGKSATSGVKSMNNANQVAQQKTAVDVLSAIILLLKLESKWFGLYQRQAWEQEDILTDKGMRHMEECFNGVKVAEYQMSIATFDGGHRAIVNKASVNSKH